MIGFRFFVITMWLCMDYIHNGYGVELASSKNSATFFPYFLHRWLITDRFCALAQPPVGFFTGWAMRVLNDGSLPAGSRDRTLVRVWGFASGSWRHFLKIMHKIVYLVHWDFRQLTFAAQKALYNISIVQVPPCPRVRAHMRNSYVAVKTLKKSK